MSRVYSKNKKELAGVKLIPARKAWKKDKSNKVQLDRSLNIVGKIDMSIPNMVLKANQANKKTAFIEDVSALPKRTKNEIVNHFYDDNGKRNKNSVAYLVRTDSNAKQKTKNKKEKGK